MKHIFLTGESGVGKTTLLNRLFPPGTRTCGFLTERVQTTDCIGVYLYAPARERFYTQGNRVGSWETGVMVPHPEIFETLGVALLSQLPPDRQIIMDELGVLEQDAPRFCSRVLELLDGDRSIWGVVKNRQSMFLDAVRSHSKVEIISVNKNNRDALYARLREHIT